MLLNIYMSIKKKQAMHQTFPLKFISDFLALFGPFRSKIMLYLFLIKNKF